MRGSQAMVVGVALLLTLNMAAYRYVTRSSKPATRPSPCSVDMLEDMVPTRPGQTWEPDCWTALANVLHPIVQEEPDFLTPQQARRILEEVRLGMPSERRLWAAVPLLRVVLCPAQRTRLDRLLDQLEPPPHLAGQRSEPRPKVPSEAVAFERLERKLRELSLGESEGLPQVLEIEPPPRPVGLPVLLYGLEGLVSSEGDRFTAEQAQTLLGLVTALRMVRQPALESLERAMAALDEAQRDTLSEESGRPLEPLPGDPVERLEKVLKQRLGES